MTRQESTPHHPCAVSCESVFDYRQRRRRNRSVGAYQAGLRTLSSNAISCQRGTVEDQLHKMSGGQMQSLVAGRCQPLPRRAGLADGDCQIPETPHRPALIHASLGSSNVRT
ncbi:hypothetical protein LSAT2_012923 [Lamellibrachia satsuma]|nr:hypothetical protein LSAT2_012923 [Lamellibrachia satsuma]